MHDLVTLVAAAAGVQSPSIITYMPCLVQLVDDPPPPVKFPRPQGVRVAPHNLRTAAVGRLVIEVFNVGLSVLRLFTDAREREREKQTQIDGETEKQTEAERGRRERERQGTNREIQRERQREAERKRQRDTERGRRGRDGE